MSNTHQTTHRRQHRQRPRRFRPGLTRAGATTALLSIALGGGCDDAAPADDVLVARLSSRETLALCDELRDAVSGDDRPIQCESGERYWVLPSNEVCLDLDVSSCGVTAGELRRCLAEVQRNPCDERPECAFLDGCAPLLPNTARAGAPTCTEVSLAQLQSLDGVYEVTAPPASSAGSCPGELPAVLEPETPYLVLVSIEASGAPEVVVQSCGSIPECQALARELRASGSPPDSPYHRLLACEEAQLAGAPLVLQSKAPDLPACQIAYAPQVTVNSADAELSVTISGLADAGEASPGCGHVTANWTCGAFIEYRTAFAAPL